MERGNEWEEQYGLSIAQQAFREVFKREFLGPLINRVMVKLITDMEYQELLKQGGWKS